MSSDKVYLGDGAYVDFDGYNILLTTEDGIKATNSIVMEPEVLSSFLVYINRLMKRNGSSLKEHCNAYD